MAASPEEPPQPQPEYGLQHISDFCLMSDSGPHFRSSQTVSSAATRWLQVLRRENHIANPLDTRDCCLNPTPQSISVRSTVRKPFGAGSGRGLIKEEGVGLLGVPKHSVRNSGVLWHGYDETRLI